MTNPVAEIPLFPLGTVLFPGGPLALRIFGFVHGAHIQGSESK